MAGKIPQEFIDELLERVDIVDIIDQRVPLRKAGKDFQARCPFHDERTPSFTVSQSKQFYHCFGCGAGGNVISFLMDYDHMEFPEAIEELAGRVGMQIPREARHAGSPDKTKRDTLLPLLERAGRYFQSQLRKHPEAGAAVEYLKQRGLSGEIAQRFELGFAPDSWDALIRALSSGADDLPELERAGLVIRGEADRFYDRFRGRIMFPIRDHRGRTVGFGGRIIGSGEPKYLNSPETPAFHKGSELYNLYGARGTIRDLDTAVVVEGYMDVVALAQHGIDHAIAALGTATTAQHLHRLFRLASHVVFCFDGDRAGRDAARKAMEIVLPEMHGGRQVSFLFLPEGQDPDDFIREQGADAFRAAVETATPLDEFLFDQLRSRIDLRRQDGRARLVELARPMISAIPPGPYKEMLTRKLGTISGLDDQRYLADIMIGGARQPATRRGPTRETTQISTYAYLLSLLLQHPRLARDLPELEGLDEQERPAARILANVIAILREDDLTSTAALVERFRDTPYHERLEKLAARNHQFADGVLEEILIQTAHSVQRLLIDDAIDKLIEKASGQSLSEAEKADLKRFTQMKQALRMDSTSAV